MDIAKVGVLTESFRKGLYGGIDEAHSLGLKGLQVHTGAGEARPDNLKGAERKKLRDYIQDRGMTISSFCGDLGGHGWVRPEDNPAKIDMHKQQVDLAVELGCDCITTHIGVIPPDPAHPRYDILADVCRTLGAYGQSAGVRFAIETGPEPSTVLLGFLEYVDCPAIGVNLDPANLVMVTGDDPARAVRRLKGHIFHTHVKDGKMLRYVGPERVYLGVFAEGGIEDDRMGALFIETPLGEGDVDFPAYFAALDEIGYAGWHAIEREVGPDPKGDIQRAMDYLRAI